MSSVAIVGGGQSGLHLALGLLQQDVDVTVITNRTAEQIRDGRVTSSQNMNATSLDAEREVGIHFWEDLAPEVNGGAFAFGIDGELQWSWSAQSERPAQSVDQRVKFPRWTDEFVARGGDLRIQEVDVDTLEELTRDFDLVVVAAGKGDIARMFERDDSRSPYSAPQRALALTYVNGIVPRADHTAVSFNIVPGVGEYFWFPSYTLTGPCEIFTIEAVPGGPMDVFQNTDTPQVHLEKSVDVIEKFFPWEKERVQNVALTDDGGTLAGRFPPTVRRPVATLPSGRKVLGMGDVVVLNDPVTGQGSNNAAKCARVYLAEITARGDRPFDEEWMNQTFAKYWDIAQWSTAWTNSLIGPPQPQIGELLAAASETPALAQKIVGAFGTPEDFAPWWFDPAEANALISTLRR